MDNKVTNITHSNLSNESLPTQTFCVKPSVVTALDLTCYLFLKGWSPDFDLVMFTGKVESPVCFIAVVLTLFLGHSVRSA